MTRQRRFRLCFCVCRLLPKASGYRLFQPLTGRLEPFAALPTESRMCPARSLRASGAAFLVSALLARRWTCGNSGLLGVQAAGRCRPRISRRGDLHDFPLRKVQTAARCKPHVRWHLGPRCFLHVFALQVLWTGLFALCANGRAERSTLGGFPGAALPSIPAVFRRRPSPVPS